MKLSEAAGKSETLRKIRKDVNYFDVYIYGAFLKCATTKCLLAKDIGGT